MVQGTFYIFLWRVILKKDENDLNKVCAPHSWMRLVKNSNTEILGASEVPQSRGKLFF